ncbi:MAG TPA: hypothetical protein VN679_15335 [Candidatus Acidoferrales bacterium]|nr:hypothetical protein [Candidatus Acidoferrales bacterium]
MRKISSQTVDAIIRATRLGKSWEKDNTRVEPLDGNKCRVILHGHVIAFVTDTNRNYTVEINLCGYNTPTTRERLSAIVSAFVPGCCGVGTKLGQPSIRYMDSSKDRNIASDGWIVV